MMSLMRSLIMTCIFLGPAAMALTTRDELVRLAGYGEERVSTVVVSGTLFCDDDPIPGASVGVWCDRRPVISRVKSKTDEYGDFVVDLPSHLHAIPNMEKRCRVKIVGVPRKSPCHKSAAAKSKQQHMIMMIQLPSSGNGIRTYSTHNIHLTRGTKPYTSYVVINK